MQLYWPSLGGLLLYLGGPLFHWLHLGGPVLCRVRFGGPLLCQLCLSTLVVPCSLSSALVVPCSVGYALVVPCSVGSVLVLSSSALVFESTPASGAWPSILPPGLPLPHHPPGLMFLFVEHLESAPY